MMEVAASFHGTRIDSYLATPGIILSAPKINLWGCQGINLDQILTFCWCSTPAEENGTDMTASATFASSRV